MNALADRGIKFFSKCFFPAKVLIVQHALKHGGIKHKNLLFISES